MIEIMNLRTTRPSQPWDVKVDRSSVLGNPFKGDRDVDCDKYAVHFATMLTDPTSKAVAFRAELARLAQLYKQYGKLRLFCWCAPLRCHSETIRTWLMTQGQMVIPKYYTGVGSRKTPENVLALMTLTADLLEQRGYILRSGGAEGADRAFEQGLRDQRNKQIYYAEQASPAAMELAAKYHPAWHHCKPYARKLHGRNSFQVLGFDLDAPSKFLICWTKDGCVSHKDRSIQTGGTGTAISIAEAYGVRIINLQHPEQYNTLLNWVNNNIDKIRR